MIRAYDIVKRFSRAWFGAVLFLALCGCGGGSGGGTTASNATGPTGPSSSLGSDSGGFGSGTGTGTVTGSGSGTGTGTGGTAPSGPPTPVVIVPTTPIAPSQTTTGGTLVLNIGGAGQGTTYQYVNVAGSATLAGSLVVNFVNGFVPQHGEVFTLMTAAKGISGDFNSVVTNNVPFTTGQTANTFFITVD